MRDEESGSPNNSDEMALWRFFGWVGYFVFGGGLLYGWYQFPTYQIYIAFIMGIWALGGVTHIAHSSYKKLSHWSIVILFIGIYALIGIGLAWIWLSLPESKTYVVNIAVILGLTGIYPIAYIAYLCFGSKAKHERLKTEFRLLGLTSEEELDENINDLYQTVYSPVQFIMYITLIVVTSMLIIMGYRYRQNLHVVDEQTMLLIFYSYLGAYVFSIQELTRRYNTFDLQPQVYSSILTRMLVAASITFVGASTLLANGGQFVSDATANGQPETLTWAPGILAFVIGVFPTRGIRWFTQQANRILNSSDDQRNELHLRDLSGISIWHEARLAELGIDDVQNLATVDIRKLLLATQFDPLEIINWIDQAILYVKVGDKIGRFREARITTFYELQMVLNQFSFEALLEGDKKRFYEENESINKFATVLGLADAAELVRLADYTNFPNCAYVAEYYTRIGMVIRRWADIGMENVIGAIENTDFEKAIENGERLLQHHPDNPELLNILGEAYYHLEQDEKAVGAFTKAIELDVDETLASAYYNRSLIYLKRKDYQQVIQDCTKAIDISREHAEAFNNRATAYMSLGEWEHALADLKEALKLDKHLGIAYYNRGVIYNAQLRFDDALKDLERADLLGYREYHEVDIWLRKGESFLGLGSYKEAIEELSQTILYRPDWAKSYAKRGYAYLQLGSQFYPKAQKDLETAIEKDKGLLDAQVNLGLLKARQSKNEEAIEYYTRVLEQNPSHIVALYNRGIAYLRMGNHDKTQEDFTCLVGLDPTGKYVESKEAQAWLSQI